MPFREELTFILLLFITACAGPTGTVFEDQRLAQEEEVKICMTGDMGKGSDHQRIMTEFLRRERCHRIFFLGDLVYPEGIGSISDPQLEEKFLSYYSPLLEENPNLEIGLLLGNHDHAGNPSAWKEVAKNYPGYYFPHYYYLIDYGGLCLVALDSSFHYYEKKIVEAAKQSAWLTRLQPRLKECMVKVAMTHHPYRGEQFAEEDSGWKGARGGLKGFLDSFVVGTFDLHVAGHIHTLADDGKDEGTKLLITGAGGESKGRGRSGYLVLTWRPSNPKSLAYRLQYLDMKTNVQEVPAQEQQQERIEERYEKSIPKSRVEEPWHQRLINSIKRFFHE